VPRLVKEQCEVRGWPDEWIADEVVTLQLAVVDKKTKSQLLPIVSQEPAQAQPGSAVGLCVGDVRVRVVGASEQKVDQAEVVVEAMIEPRDHQFDIRVKVANTGENRLRVWVRDVEVSNSPFTLHVKANHVCEHYVHFELDCGCRRYSTFFFAAFLLQYTPPSCLQLPHLSTYSSRQLQCISASEFATPTPGDNMYRLAVSDTSVPADRCSNWAAVIKANTAQITMGVIANNVIEQGDEGRHNFKDSTFCGIRIHHDGKQASVCKNGHLTSCSEIASAVGDVLLFRLDPLQRQLKITNNRTRQAIDITEVARGDPDKPLFITMNLCANTAHGSLTQMELRQVTAAERSILQ
jgi:hypothetical protein